MKTGNTLIIVLLSAFLSCLSFGQDKNNFNSVPDRSSELDAFFNNTVSAQKYVGLGACLIKDENIIWENTYGYSDLEIKKKLKKDDIFLLCSLSKTVTAAALMKLYEEGLFRLDDDINNYMPIKIRNPKFPDKPLTFRMLLTHTAGFADVNPKGCRFSYGVTGDSKIPLGEFVEALFIQGGSFYSEDNFSSIEPGTIYEYSNIAYALIGYLVEKISREDFSDYCRRNIFDPLGMTNSAWHIRDLDPERLVFQYILSPDSLYYKKIKHYSEHGYTAGCLRTTMDDFARFLSVLMNRGKYKDIQIFKPETVEEMLRPQGIKNIPSRSYKVTDIAICWLITSIDGEEYYTMNGFSGSMFTNALFSVKQKSAFLFYYTGINMKNMAASVEITRNLISALKDHDSSL